MKISGSTYKRHQRGDTLIEIAFALVIVGFIIGVAIHGAIKAHQASVTARKRTQATYLAQSQIDMVQAMKSFYTYNGFLSSYYNVAGWGTAGTNTVNNTVLGQLYGVGMTDNTTTGSYNSTTKVCSPATPVPGNPSPEFHLLPYAAILAPWDGSATYYIPSVNLFTGSINGNSEDSISGLGHVETEGLKQLYDLADDPILDPIRPENFGWVNTDATTVQRMHANNYRGFVVSARAYLTDKRISGSTTPCGFGVGDVTIVATVTWTDANGNEQKVEQIDRISTNFQY